MNSKVHLIAAFALISTIAPVDLCLSQVRIRRVEIQPGVRLGPLTTARPDQATAVDNGASLKTDAQLESSLSLANRYRDDGNYNAATQLWQAVLNKSGDTLYSEDDQLYFSLVEQVERIIAGLPPEGLQVYRISADANAKEILAAAAGGDEVEALNRVVRQYFLSSQGDEAAFRLGCTYLDQFDFIGARRVFNKILDLYPDPTVSKDEIELRLALCNSFLGDATAAEKRLANVDTSDSRIARRADLVRDSLGSLTLESVAARARNSLPMMHGDVKRYGLMPDLPLGSMSTDLAAIWQYYFEPRERRYSNFADAQGDTLISPSQAAGTVSSEEEKLIALWSEKNWRPAGHLLIDQGNVFFKSAADLIAWDTREIDGVIANHESPKPLWRSLWQNSFRLDDASQLYNDIRKNFGVYGRRRGAKLETNRPTSAGQVQLFGDAVFQQMSVHESVLYTIEGERFEQTNNTSTARNGTHWNAVFRRTRDNYLAAYDAQSGKALWRLPRLNAKPDGKRDQNQWLDSAGFMAAPIGYKEWILVPVNHGGAISIYALDPRQGGKTVWSSFLGDEPESSAQPWAPIHLSLDGSDLFVSCGMGVIFVLDPSTGMIRFAKRYPRSGSQDSSFRRLGWSNSRTIFDGWADDLIIPYGRQMICLCSDSNVIRSLDRNSGEQIWYFELETHYGLKFDYLLGVYNDVLYAAGEETIVAIDLKSEGRLLWGGDQMFGGKKSYGRGMLTSKGIFVPVGKTILQFDLLGDKYEPKQLAMVDVDLGIDAPVGNLFSDGTRIWVHGGNRLYALDSVAKVSEQN